MEYELDSKKAIEFLRYWAPKGYWTLSSLHPETGILKTVTFPFTEENAAYDWIVKHNGIYNLYFSVNQPKSQLFSKASKNDIKRVEWLHVDIDPAPGKKLKEQQTQIIDKLTSRLPEWIPRPTCIIFSGGGYQAFWKLKQPILIDEPEIIESIERYNIQLEKALGGDSCHDISRIMRLPWTLNIPGPKKVKAGRTPVLATVVYQEDTAYEIEAFNFDSTPPPSNELTIDSNAIKSQVEEDLVQGAVRLSHIELLGENWGVPRRTQLLIVEGEGDDEEKLKKKQAGKDLSRSGWLFDVVCELERRGVPRPLILGIITDATPGRFKISESVLEHPTGPDRYGRKQIRDAAKLVAEQRLDHLTKVEDILYTENIDHILRNLCYGERPKVNGTKTKEEAEELDPLLKAMNKRFTFVKNVGGKPRIVSFYHKPEIGNGHYLGMNKVTRPDFSIQYEGYTVVTGFSEGPPPKPLTAKMTDWWLRHPFKNEKQRIVFSPMFDIPDALNEWRGFTYKPSTRGKCDLFLDHITENLCHGNKEYSEYLLNWCARMYQYPGKQGLTAVVLKGGSGVGKSFFAEELGELLVSNFFATAQAERLTSNFNSIFKTTILLFADEAFFAGNRQSYDVMKKLLVSPTLDVEAKGYEQETVANNLHLILASNHKFVVPAQEKDRRLFVLNVSDRKQKDIEYFRAIKQQLQADNGAGYESLFHYFLTRDISKFHVDQVPQTEALAQQKDYALEPIDEWYLDCLDMGQILSTKEGWPALVSKNDLYNDYMEIAKNRSFSKYDRMSKRALGEYLVSMGANARGCMRMKGVKNPIAAYKLPTLKEARDKWEEIKGPREWSEDLNEGVYTTDEQEIEQFEHNEQRLF